MNKLDRLRVINAIAIKLQESYTTTQINVFLQGFGINNSGEVIVPSKRVYVEQKLSLVSDITLKSILKELKINGIESENKMSRHELLAIKEKIIQHCVRMDFSRIDLILDEYNAPKHYFGDFDSVDDYVKFKISEFSPDDLIEILEYLQKRKGLDINPDFWAENKLRVFISHLSKDKVKASKLSSELGKHNLSAFVAHEDIEPNEKWLEKIEQALMSMDIMIALVTEGFKDSNWTTQEIGFALGRGIPVISIKNGMDPFGFFGKKQAISGSGKRANEITREIINILRKMPEYSEYIKTGE